MKELDIDKLLSAPEFDVLDEGTKAEFKELHKELEGKRPEEIASVLIGFNARRQSQRPLNPKEKEAIIALILTSVDDEQRKRIEALLRMLK